MGYDKKVKYLDYYESGQRVCGCGFVKLEFRDGRLKLTLALRGIRGADGQQKEVMLCAGKKEYVIGKMSIVRGAGEFRYEGRPQWEGIPMQEELLDGVCVHIGADREVSSRWKSLSQGSVAAKILPQEEIKAAEKKAERAQETTRTERRPEIQAERRPETRGESGVEARSKAPVRLLEDKWAQIYSIYPHVRPFQDEREYLSIGPADFLLFPAAAYKQVNNSFLLHGFYNYKHLILTRVERRGEIVYYIGVPGNFYEREKQVAVMFGFESFECAAEPAQDGDFGYYMMRTQL